MSARYVSRAAWTAACAALLAVALPASAQQVSLANVEALAEAGETREARTLLTRWIEAVDGNAPRLDLQRSLWLRAVLTVDPEQAAFDLRRLVVEYPGGGWTDKALLRLARYEEARGETARAAARYRELLRDYPTSPARLDAQAWLDENATLVARAEAAAAEALPDESSAEPENPAPAAQEEAPVEPPVPEEAAPAEASGDEPVSRVAPPAADPEEDVRAGAEAPPPDTLGRERLARPRPVTVATDPTTDPGTGTRPEPGTADSAPVTPDPEPPAAGAGAAGDETADGDFTVQLGAFASESRARSLVARARDAGFEPRLVSMPGSELVRVRIGRFADPEAATRMYDRISAQGFDAAVVADAAREVPAGGEGER